MSRSFVVAGILMGLACPAVVAEQQPGRTTLRVASYNIKHGRGMDGKVNVERTGDVLARMGADLVALQEVDKNCNRSGRQDIAAVLGKRLGMEHRFASFMDFEGGQYGLAVLSKHPIQDVRRIVLPRGSMEPRAALEVVVQPKDSPVPVSFVCLHLDWIEESSRVTQMRALLEAFKETKHPVILAGDFNCQRPAKPMRMLEEDGWTILDKQGKKTFPSDEPRSEIDFFVVRGFKELAAESDVIDEPMASDHRPIVATIAGRP
ncbi:MAG: endonuclease/exonuclease/phosphatase family protein [Pirellulales bacterium]|nr:endonuclease/exonuclease/phosphatase family protein [Pirellulales bacterium]